MQPKHPLLQKCIKQIESLPNLQVKVEVVPYISDDFLADGKLVIYRDQHPIEYVCEIKSGVTQETIADVISYLIHLHKRLKNSQRVLLIANRLSDIVIKILLDKNIEFIDSTGNIYLNHPDLYILVRREKDYKMSSEITESSLKVIFILLKIPEIFINVNERREYFIAETSGVPLPTVRRTLDKLCALNYLGKKKDNYYITDYTKLFERWEFGYLELLRSKLIINTFTSINNKLFDERATDIISQADKFNYLIGGELGASLISNNLRPISATLHVLENYRSIFTHLRLKPDPQGKITFLRQFGTNNHWKGEYSLYSCLAHPLLIHAELSMIQDERIKETSQIVYQKFISSIS